jgi:hypothetical protein
MAAQAQPVRPLEPYFPWRANWAAYLQWGAILVKMQGGCQRADHHIPPELMLAGLTTNSHIHTHAVYHSTQPDILQRQ